MRKKNYKGRCTKRTFSKSIEVVRTYDPLQYAYADILQKDESIREIQCNVSLDSLQEGKYISFVNRHSGSSAPVMMIPRKALRSRSFAWR